MRRILSLFVMIGVVGVLVPVLAVLAQSSSITSAPACCSPATCTASKPSASSSTDAKIIDEMIAILKETKSEETFVVAAMALGQMGPEAKRALPQLIRNAERLKLLEDVFASGASKGDRQVAQHVAEAIVMLAAGQPMGYLSTTSSTPYANGSYGSPSVVGGGNQTTVVPSAVPAYPTAASFPAGSQSAVPPPVMMPGAVPTPAVPSPTPLPAVKNASPTGRPASTPAAPPPPSTR